MSTNLSRRDALLAGIAGVTGVAGSFAIAGNSRQFVVAPIDAAVVRTTPGPIVAWMIENVGEAGHLLHVALSIAIAVGVFAGVAALGVLAARRLSQPVVGVGLAGGLAWALTAALTAEPVLALGAAVPVAAFTAVSVAPASSTGHDPSRRRVLVSGAGALAFVGAAIGVGRLTSGTGGSGAGIGGSGAVTGGDDSASGPGDAVDQRLRQAEQQSLDMASDDLPGLVSSIEEFYNVDIAQFDPEVPSADWSLTVTGEVEDEMTLSFEDLTDRPTEHRYVTLRCVGERLNGEKMDTAVWTGTPIKPLLEAVDPNGECDCVMLRAEDDYFVQFPVEALEDGLLAWEMNGQPLPTSHGHPVRVLVPGHWGETNVKWVEEIELLDEETDGYWEQRGWHGTGPVNTVAKLWADTRLEDGRIEVAGHAYAGTRGIDRVEVSIDGGDTWSDAELSEPLPGEDVWRQWRYTFDPDGSHEVVVRATDGEGTLQPQEREDSFPSGATGWVRETIDP